eukprot:Ihof_evm9s216 gene=Ihof_evmTU9s216
MEMNDDRVQQERVSSRQPTQVSILEPTPTPTSDRVHLQQIKHHVMRSGKSDPTFTIKLQRSTYYDNDNVEGTLTILCEKEVVLPPIYVALLCRLITKESARMKAAAYTIF